MVAWGYRKAHRGEVNCGLCDYVRKRHSGRYECTHGLPPYYQINRAYTCNRARSTRKGDSDGTN